MRFLPILLVGAILIPTIALASSEDFKCTTSRFFGKAPCGKESYSVPDGSVIKFKLDLVEHNYQLKVRATDTSGQEVSDWIVVSPGSETIIWSNHTGKNFDVKLEVSNDEWRNIVSKGTVTGTVTVD